MKKLNNMGMFNKQKVAGVKLNKKDAETTQNVLSDAERALQGDPLQQAVEKNKQK